MFQQFKLSTVVDTIFLNCLFSGHLSCLMCYLWPHNLLACLLLLPSQKFKKVYMKGANYTFGCWISRLLPSFERPMCACIPYGFKIAIIDIVHRICLMHVLRDLEETGSFMTGK